MVLTLHTTPHLSSPRNRKGLFWSVQLPTAASRKRKIHVVHSQKLTWKPKKGPIKTTVLLQGDYMGFHVSLGECSYMTRQATHANKSIEDVHFAFHVLVRIIPQCSKLCTLYPQYSKLDNSKQRQPSSSLAP